MTNIKKKLIMLRQQYLVNTQYAMFGLLYYYTETFNFAIKSY